MLNTGGGIQELPLMIQYIIFCSDILIPKNCLEIAGELPVSGPENYPVNITGLSMGGHGALTLFMQNPERFRAAGSMSGVMHLRSSSVSGSIAKKIGPKTQANSNWENYSVLYNVDKLAAAGKPIIVNCGAQDYLVKVNRDFAAKCKAQNVNIVYSESPGKHERDYWKLTLPGQLMYFRQFVNKSQNYENQ